MNKHLKNLNRIEFVVTMACTGKCKHCSQGEHKNSDSIDKVSAANTVRKIAEEYKIQSVMTFGAEPLLRPEADNPYNNKTKEILARFNKMGIETNEGNVIFPSGNALKYLSEYFDLSKKIKKTYDEDPTDIRAICLSANGDLLGSNICKQDVTDILKSFSPE